MSDPAEQIDVVGPVIAAAAASLQRLDLLEARLPETQDVLRQVQVTGDFTDGPECLGCLFRHGLPFHHADAFMSGVSSAPSPALMRCLRMAEGLKTMTRRGEIGTSLPVLGLRPMRWPFLRTTNEPNDESFTVSPRSRQSVISFNTISTRVADSVRDRPTFW